MFKDTGEGRKDPDSPKGGEELRTVSLRANALKGNIVLGNYGVSQFHCLYLKWYTTATRSLTIRNRLSIDKLLLNITLGSSNTLILFKGFDHRLMDWIMIILSQTDEQFQKNDHAIVSITIPPMGSWQIFKDSGYQGYSQY